MSLEVHVIASGSKGNATILRHKNTAVLIDAGISARRITTALKELHIPLSHLSGIVVTHEHSDHIAGIPQMIKQYGVPIYTRPETAKQLMWKKALGKEAFIPIGVDEFRIGDLHLQPFSTSHDAVDPIGLSCYTGGHKGTIMTDTGLIDEIMLRHMDESDILVLEANYDKQMLRYGPYPPDLKRRVASHEGHLSNDDAVAAIVDMKRQKEMDIIFAHRSEKNNAVPIVDLMGRRLQEQLYREHNDVIHFYHGDPKDCISVCK